MSFFCFSDNSSFSSVMLILQIINANVHCSVSLLKSIFWYDQLVINFAASGVSRGFKMLEHFPKLKDLNHPQTNKSKSQRKYLFYWLICFQGRRAWPLLYRTLWLWTGPYWHPLWALLKQTKPCESLIKFLPQSAERERKKPYLKHISWRSHVTLLSQKQQTTNCITVYISDPIYKASSRYFNSLTGNLL